MLTDTDSLMLHEFKFDNIYGDFGNDNETLIFVIILWSLIGKMKDKTTGIAIEEFVRLKPKLCSYLVDDNSEHKNAKGVNRNAVATLSFVKFCWQ